MQQAMKASATRKRGIEVDDTAPTYVDPKILPRVSTALTLNDLKEECRARDMKGYSALKKEGLLDELKVGSICISQMKEYKVIEEVKALMKKEEMRGKEAKAEPPSHKASDTGAPTSILTTSKPKVESEDHPPFKRTKMTASKDGGRSQPRTREQIEVYIQSKNIKKPADIHLNQNKLLKYVVWSSAGYPRDGWHSYAGEPQKKFDSSWKTIVEANKRANFVFFEQNIWGLSREEVEERNYRERFDEKDGFVNYYVHPDASEEYTVSVVDKEEFERMLVSQNRTVSGYHR